MLVRDLDLHITGSNCPRIVLRGLVPKVFPAVRLSFDYFLPEVQQKVVFGPEGLTSTSVNYVAEARNLVLYLNMGLWLLWYAQQELW